jgi:glycerophosphoryl diester phosphodiesterase
VNKLLCIGHRGACGHEPENTLRSVRRALELGADGVEIDVRLVQGELVVFHDAKLDRTTNGGGLLSRKTLAQVRALDAGLGEQIPTLREVLEAVDRRGLVNIELKGRRTAGPVEALIGEFVRERGWLPEQFLVSSFHRRELKQISDPAVRIGMLCARPTRLYSVSARRLGAWSVHPALRYTTARFVKDAHRRGLKVLVYTVNAPADIARMRAIGVDGVFTDFPERV